jgi:hypothetical protein
MGNTGKIVFVKSGFFESSLQHRMVTGGPSCLQIDPRWSLDAPWVLLDATKIKLKLRQNQTNEKWKPGNLEIRKDAHRTIVETGLVEILNLNGVPFGDEEKDSLISMDYLWNISG